MTPDQFGYLRPGDVIYRVPVNKLHFEIIKEFDEHGYMTTLESGKQVHTSDIQREFYLTIEEAVKDRLQHVDYKIDSAQRDLDSWNATKKKVVKILEDAKCSTATLT